MSNPSQYPATPAGRVPRLSTETERTVGIVAHLSAIVAAIVSAGWLSIVGPLVIFLLYKDRSPLVRSAAAGAFNFNLAIWAMIVAGWICLFTVILAPITVVLWLVAGIAGIFCHVRGAMRASKGQSYRYPFSIGILS